MQARQYQYNLKQAIYSAWQSGAKNVGAVLPTGGGKTFIFSEILKENNCASCAIAHRQELVSQISLALAKQEVDHKIIGPKNVVKWIIQLQVREYGRNFYNANSHRAVAGVDTLIRRRDTLQQWLPTVGLWVTDEGHHVLRSNKWGKAVDLFPNARGLSVTATLCRADGKGLGRHADGVLDTFVEGPTMRELISMGYLTDYRIFGPPSDLKLENVAISKTTGDFNPHQLKQEVRRSHIVGDVVEHYLKIAQGKRGITFATDVETATDISRQYRAAGVSAEVVHGKTPDKQRIEIIRRFREGLLTQLVNVDIFGEGFDLPAVEVVSFARPTESYGLYAQQFGRALRPIDGKQWAIIIDHVGNVKRHGLPDAPRTFTLNRREARRKSHDPDVIPVKNCPNCTLVYERIYKKCPYCGYESIPGERSKPEYVDGDLTELDFETLSAMRGEIARIDEPANMVSNRLLHAGAGQAAAGGAAKNHRIRQEQQHKLRDVIAIWAGCQRQLGRQDSESYRRFYFKFGVDVMSAQTLGRKDAEELTKKICLAINHGDL